jgi:hypothetical protein
VPFGFHSSTGKGPFYEIVRVINWFPGADIQLIEVSGFSSWNQQSFANPASTHDVMLLVDHVETERVK